MSVSSKDNTPTVYHPSTSAPPVSFLYIFIHHGVSKARPVAHGLRQVHTLGELCCDGFGSFSDGEFSLVMLKIA